MAFSMPSNEILELKLPVMKYMFGTPQSLQTPLISPSLSRPQVFFILSVISSPHNFRMGALKSPKLWKEMDFIWKPLKRANKVDDIPGAKNNDIGRYFTAIIKLDAIFREPLNVDSTLELYPAIDDHLARAGV